MLTLKNLKWSWYCTLLFAVSLCLRLRWLLVLGQAKMQWHYTRKLAAVAWMRILDFFSRYMDWVPANIMTEFFHCFWRYDRNSGCRCFYHSLPEFLGGWPSTLNDSGCWHWVMAVCHHYSRWRWWPDTYKVMTKICGCGVPHDVIEMYCIHVFPSIC